MTKQNYDASSLDSFEGLEAVRHRPGMYIGDTGKDGLMHLIWEIVANSTDEHMAGYGDKIIITFEKDMCIVQDFGRGIPSGIVPKTGLNGIEHCLTVLHAGGKLGNANGYQKSGGLHGVGASCVNALSTYMRCEVVREGTEYSMVFSRGKVVEKLKSKPTHKKLSGTRIEFIPDNTIMEECEFDFDALLTRMKDVAYLNKKLTFELVDNRTDKPVKEVIHFDNGVVDYIKDKNKGKFTSPVFINFTNIDEVSNHHNEYEIAMVFTENSSEDYSSFVNNISCKEGGTHVTGFRTALTNSVNAFARQYSLLKDRDENLTSKEMSEGIIILFNLKLTDPKFKGQTKDALSNTEVQGQVQSGCYQFFKTYFEDNPKDITKVIERVLRLRRAREKANEVFDSQLKKTSTLFSKVPGKLSDCKQHGLGSEIFLVEGRRIALFKPL